MSSKDRTHTSSGEGSTRRIFMALPFGLMRRSAAHGVIRALFMFTPLTECKSSYWPFTPLMKDDSNRTSVFRQVLAYSPVQTNYLNSEWSYAQYRLPTPPAHVAHSYSTTNRLGTIHPDAGDEEKWTVGWITLPPDITPHTSPNKPTTPLPSPARSKGKGRVETSGSPLRPSHDRKPSSSSTRAPPPPEYQLVALTFTGGWYRLSLPKAEKDRAGTPEAYQGSGKTAYSGTRDRVGSPQLGGSRRSTEKRISPRRNSDAQNDGNKCQLEEFRRFGRWDGWG